jgi:hypothetical protein
MGGPEASAGSLLFVIKPVTGHRGHKWVHHEMLLRTL